MNAVGRKDIPVRKLKMLRDVEEFLVRERGRGLGFRGRGFVIPSGWAGCVLRSGVRERRGLARVGTRAPPQSTGVRTPLLSAAGGADVPALPPALTPSPRPVCAEQDAEPRGAP